MEMYISVHCDDESKAEYGASKGHRWVSIKQAGQDVTLWLTRKSAESLLAAVQTYLYELDVAEQPDRFGGNGTIQVDETPEQEHKRFFGSK